MRLLVTGGAGFLGGYIMATLLRTARQLHPEDMEELIKYAEFRRARRIYKDKSRPRSGRKGGKHK